MPRHFEKRVLPYPCDFLYGIVADVGQYPDFLPWVKEAIVFNKAPKAFDAKLVVGYNALVQTSYTSRVHLTPFERIEIEYLSGPFRHLENRWVFRPLGDHTTEIEFLIDFSFKNPILQNFMESFFNQALKTTLKAFEGRAGRVFRDH